MLRRYRDGRRQTSQGRGQPAAPQVQPLQQTRPAQEESAGHKLYRVLQEVAVAREYGGQ